MITNFKNKPRPRLWVGRKTLANMKANARLKRKFTALGITSCELHLPNCTRDNFLTWAHGKKRRKLVGDELETCVILACTFCHAKLEVMGPDLMLTVVQEVISERNRRIDERQR